ncbi:MAG: phosphotransferase [Planctomycetota bacterium]
MLPALAARWNESVVAHAAAKYGVRPSDLERLAGFENFVFEADGGASGWILRISHSMRRTADYTMGEVQWVTSLAAAGLPVAGVLRSRHGNLVEIVAPDEEGYFVATAFERAPGVLLDDAPAIRRACWAPDLFEQWGDLLARLHLHARRFTPSAPAYRRQQWFEYDVLDGERWLPPNEVRVREVCQQARRAVESLPRHADAYGLIHADLTQRNFCYGDGRITAFDFDNCEYGWFVRDLAVAIYYVALDLPDDERNEGTSEFAGHLLRGYGARRTLERSWLEALPRFLRLQRVMNYVLAAQLNEREPTPEQRDQLRRRRELIEADEPVVGVDFARL